MTAIPVGAGVGPVGSAAITAGFQGADVAGLDRVAVQARQGADRLERTTGWMGDVVVSLRQASWFTGGASAAYADHLDTVVVPWLRTSAEAMRRAAEVLVEQAQQQRDASNDTLLSRYEAPPLPSGDTRTPGGGPSDGRPWWRALVPGAERVRQLAGWFDNVVGLGTSTLTVVRDVLVREVEVWRRRGAAVVRDGSRFVWRLGTPDFLRRLASAETIARLARSPVARMGGPLTVVTSGIAQGAEDWHRDDLTRGQRIARVGAAMIIDGSLSILGGIGGTAAGIVIGAPAGPVGMVVGGIGIGTAGSLAGAQAGQHIRGRLERQILWVGDRIDGGSSWVGDRARNAVDQVRGWFGATEDPSGPSVAATPIRHGGGLGAELPTPAATTGAGPSWHETPSWRTSAVPELTRHPDAIALPADTSIAFGAPMAGALAPIDGLSVAPTGATTAPRFADGGVLGTTGSRPRPTGEAGP